MDEHLESSLTTSVPDRQEVRLGRPVPRGFCAFAVEYTGLELLDLYDDGMLDAASEARVALRQMPERLHDAVKFGLKSLLPVDEDYKRELFEVASGQRLPRPVVRAVDRYIEKNREEYEEWALSEMLEPLPEDYRRNYLTLGAYAQASGLFVGWPVKTILTDLANVAYARFLLREAQKRVPGFDTEQFGPLPELLRGEDGMLEQELGEVTLTSKEFIEEEQEGDATQHLFDEDFSGIDPEFREMITSSKYRGLVEYLAAGSIHHTDSYKAVINYGKAIEGYLLTHDQKLAQAAQRVAARPFEAKGFELLGLPSDIPIEDMLWGIVEPAMPPGWHLPLRGIAFEYTDIRAWWKKGSGRNGFIPPTERAREKVPYFGGEKRERKLFLDDGTTQSQSVLIMYRVQLEDLVDTDASKNRPEGVGELAARELAPIAIHELFEEWLDQQPKGYAEGILAELKNDTATVNDPGGIRERPVEMRKIYESGVGGIAANLSRSGECSMWDVEQIIESVVAYNLTPELLKERHPNAYRAIRTMVYRLPPESQ